MMSSRVRGLIFILAILTVGSNYLFSAGTPKVGIGVRAAVFGIPNQLLDLIIYEHPEIRGQSYAIEIQSYGDRGPKSVFSGVYCLEYSKMSAEGLWRDQQENRRLDGKGEVTQMSFTATIIMNMLPRSPISLYIGGGIGVGRIAYWYEGSYTDELGTEVTNRIEENRIVPVVHVPIGIRINIKNTFEVRIEGGFKNGFYLGGGLALNL